MWNIKQLDLDIQEVEILIDALRNYEKQSRLGFARWMAINLGKVVDHTFDEKICKMTEIFRKVVVLREILGDNKPVNI